MWETEHIPAKGFTENVVDLMVAKLGRLPASTQNALKHGVYGRQRTHG